MEFTLIILAAICVASVAFNLYQFKETEKLQADIEALKRKGPESYEVRDLLRDLATGRALVKITRVEPMDVFLRSPRDMQQ